jgi:hypothetical protein
MPDAFRWSDGGHAVESRSSNQYPVSGIRLDGRAVGQLSLSFFQYLVPAMSAFAIRPFSVIW